MESPQDVGLFAYPPSGIAVLANIAPVTGVDTHIGQLTTVKVTTRPHDAAVLDVTGGASCLSEATGVLVLSGCTLTLPISATSGDAVSIVISSGALTTSIPLTVWLPTSLQLSAVPRLPCAAAPRRSRACC